jgi:hypothetical protein
MSRKFEFIINGKKYLGMEIVKFHNSFGYTVKYPEFKDYYKCSYFLDDKFIILRTIEKERKFGFLSKILNKLGM